MPEEPPAGAEPTIPAANGKELAAFLIVHVGTLDEDSGDEIEAARRLLTLDDPWSG